jgi:hypothetical protein
MRATQDQKTEYSLPGFRTKADPDEQRPLGKAYRLILSYRPQKKVAAQGKAGEATHRTDDVQSAIG